MVTRSKKSYKNNINETINIDEINELSPLLHQSSFDSQNEVNHKRKLLQINDKANFRYNDFNNSCKKIKK